MIIKTIGLCADHAGFALKEHVKSVLKAKGLVCKDYGTCSETSCDYPDFAHAMAKGMEQGEVFPAIAICSTGNGIAMTLNKHQGIRAALCWNVELASLARLHNNANILVMPGRFISNEEAEKIVETFLTGSFEGGRHQGRIDKIPLTSK